MNKRSSVESPNHQSSATPVNPALQAALGCLDVNLEAELTTYRRHRKRAEQWVSPSVRPGKQTSTGSQQPDQNLPDSAADETQQPLSIPLLAGSPTTGSGQENQSMRRSLNVQSPNNYLESSEKLIEGLDSPMVEVVEERSLAASLLTPLGLSSMLLFLVSCTALGYAVFYPSSLAKIAGLNRQNTQSETQNTASTVADTRSKELPKAPNLASKEFVELDLSTLSNVKPTVSPIASPSPKASIPPNPAAVSDPIRTVPIPTEDGNSAQLSEKGLNNLSTALLPSPSPSPSAVQTVPTLPTLPPTASPLAANSAPTATASPVAVSPTVTAPAPAATLGTPKRASDGFYYVVVDYTDAKSVEQARIAVPDAYVRKFSKGVKIQMGALNDVASAELLVKELQAKGVRPQYYQP
jgi:hypothetical protein